MTHSYLKESQSQEGREHNVASETALNSEKTLDSVQERPAREEYILQQEMIEWKSLQPLELSDSVSEYSWRASTHEALCAYKHEARASEAAHWAGSAWSKCNFVLHFGWPL